MTILLLSVAMKCNDSGSDVCTGVDKMTATYTENESVVDTRAYRNTQVYNLTANCSVCVAASDIERYHEVVAKATKLVYVHFYYTGTIWGVIKNGTKWDVIKVLDEQSKYLLALENYKTYPLFSNTLSDGIEHSNVTLHGLSEGCVIKPEDLIQPLMRLVSNNFKTLCKDDQCWENVCFKANVTSVVCAVKDNGEYTFENVYLKYVVAFIALLSLIYFTITWILISEIGNFMFLPPHTGYHCTQDKTIIILDYNTYLIGKQQVPSGILSSFVSFLVLFIVPIESWLLKNRIMIKSIQRLCLVPIFFCFPFFYTSYISYIVSFFFGPILFSLGTAIVSYFPDGLCSKRIYFPIGVIFSRISKLLLKLRTIWESSPGQNNKPLRLFYKYLHIFPFLCCYGLCPFISDFVTGYLFITLIDIIVKSNPYFPLVMAGFIYYLKLSTHLSNWYKLFFEKILDNVTSMTDKNVIEAKQSSGENSFHIVKSRLPEQKEGDGQLKVTGTPIFIDETGSVMITRSFFHKCVKSSIKHSRHNPLSLFMNCLFKLYCVIILLTIIGFIINQFGMAGQQSTAHLSLVSLASGIIPLALYSLENDSIPIEDSDTLFKKDLENLVDLYEEWFTKAPSYDKNIERNNMEI